MSNLPLEETNKRHAAVLKSLREPMTVKQLCEALHSETPLIRTSLRYLMKRGQVVALNEGYGHHPIFYQAVAGALELCP